MRTTRAPERAAAMAAQQPANPPPTTSTSKEKYVPDAQRVELVVRMVKEGFGDQIMLAGDMSRKSYWPAYGAGGGPGLTYILWRFIPWLRSAGLGSDVIDKLMMSNPARCLQW